MTIDKENACYGRQYHCVVKQSGKSVPSNIFYVQPTCAKKFVYGTVRITDSGKAEISVMSPASGVTLSGALVLPAGYHGVQVTAIKGGNNEENGAFTNQDDITSV